MSVRASVRFLLSAIVLAVAAAFLVATVWLESAVPAAPGSPAAATRRASAAGPAYPFQPRYGQSGKDVVWIPSADGVVEAMLDLAGVTDRDYVIDLGSGDGRTVIAAARRGARALGIEFDPGLVDVSRAAAEAEGVSGRASFVNGDIFESDLSRATVITMFLLPSLNVQLRPTLMGLEPGTRIVSNTFDMGDWSPDCTAPALGPCEDWCLALLWVVPASVHGTWRMPEGSLSLTQRFQFASGALTTARGIRVVEHGRLRGETITFAIGDAWYTGRVAGDEMSGTLEVAGRQAGWRATRVRRPGS